MPPPPPSPFPHLRTLSTPFSALRMRARQLSAMLSTPTAPAAPTAATTAVAAAPASRPAAPAGFDELVEGDARALYRKGQVFYNPAQVVNRDLSVLVLRLHARQRRASAPGMRVLEALSATGLRAVRYFREVEGVACVVANDLDAAAVETITRNVRHNGLDVEADVVPNCGDAVEVMTLARGKGKRYDVVDLDPYGSAAPFLDAAVQAVVDGGVLAVTCTDLPVLCGNSPEICYGRYAATPVKGATTHEMAVRIVMAAVQTAANRHGRAVEVLLCAKIDFYVRLFVRVRDSKILAQQTPSRLSMVFQCVECATQRFQPLGRIRQNMTSNAARKKKRRVEEGGGKGAGEAVGEKGAGANGTGEGNKMGAQKLPVNVKYSPPLVGHSVSPNCTICGGAMVMGGPVWNGALIGDGVAASLMKEIDAGVGNFKARDRVSAIVRLVEEEVRDVPLFMHLPSMCRILRVSPPPAASVRSVLAKKGYNVSQSHTDPQAIKTNAPPELVWDILRLWVEKVGCPFTKAKTGKAQDGAEGNGEGGKREQRLSAGERVLATKATLITADEVDFNVKKDKFVRRYGADNAQPRYPQNPEPNWGPKARAGKRKNADTTDSANS